MASDKTTYAPFTLHEDEKCRWLNLIDRDMAPKEHLFEERSEEGWTGNGYDWSSIAQVIVAEQMPNIAEELEFDPEGGMFSVTGPRAALERLGKAMAAAYHDDATLRDLLSRAEID